MLPRNVPNNLHRAHRRCRHKPAKQIEIHEVHVVPAVIFFWCFENHWKVSKSQIGHELPKRTVDQAANLEPIVHTLISMATARQMCLSSGRPREPGIYTTPR